MTHHAASFVLYLKALFLTHNSRFNAFFRSDSGVNEGRMINSVHFVFARNESFETPPSTMTQHHDSYCCSTPIPVWCFYLIVTTIYHMLFKRKSKRLKFAYSTLSWDDRNTQIRICASGFSSWRCRICAWRPIFVSLTSLKSLERGSDFFFTDFYKCRNSCFRQFCLSVKQDEKGK